ncbi:MAG: hypothetical protein J6Y02_10145 [Pseudobutyrivibrio sp.]|nr:hypothetical protein [Pseudobutyrivibrio sp.]
MLTNYQNYGPFAQFAQTGSMTISVSDIVPSTWDSYYEGLLNMFKDGIETEQIHNGFVIIYFDREGIDCQLSMVDTFFNLVMWYLIINAGEDIKPYHIYFPDNITGKSIKKYIDDFFIRVNRKTMSNIQMNNLIDDMLTKLSVVNLFSMYFANTINLEDNITLMKANKEFYDILHADLSGVPIEDVKSVGMDLTNRAIEIMTHAKDVLGYDHCLADSWRASEGVNPRQYKELSINIGSKPNGQGGVFPNIINKSFIMGGVNDPLSMFIDSSTGRTAQLLSKINVGDSGAFARILGLNNTDTFINHNQEYDCHSPNFQEIVIKNEKFLQMYVDRYYRFHPQGAEFIIHESDKHLIGQKIYLRSPMTCLSKSRGHGICYKCYGDLAYINHDVNVGKMAAEIQTSQLTQRLLSAKHLLETIIKKMKWTAEFNNYFEIEGNIIQLLPDINLKGFNMLIDPDAIYMKNEDDYQKSDYDESGSYDDEYSETYNEYITEFIVETPSGEQFTIGTEDSDEMYITNELNDIIRRKAMPVDGKISIPMQYLVDMPILLVIIHNNELSKAMERIMHIIDKNAVTKSMDRHQLLQTYIEAIIEGNLDTAGVHCEVILSNQLRDAENILECPDWSVYDAPYQILTLNGALTNHPSVVVSLMYQRLSKTLYTPLTFRKNKPSFLDLFFMVKPQDYLYNTEHIVEGRATEDDAPKIINPFIHIEEEEADDTN